jgi:hypothetical protein
MLGIGTSFFGSSKTLQGQRNSTVKFTRGRVFR